MRRAFLLLLAITLMLTGCSASLSHDTYEKIYKRYNNIESYTAEITVTARGNKGESSYKLEQTFSAPDKFSSKILKPDNMAGTEYRFENGGITFVSPGGQTAQLADYISEDEDYTSIESFFRRYYSSEDAFAEAADITGSQTRLQVMITPGSRERFMQAMWIDNKTLAPVRLVTYDIDGEETIVADIEKFEMQ